MNNWIKMDENDERALMRLFLLHDVHVNGQMKTGEGWDMKGIKDEQRLSFKGEVSSRANSEPVWSQMFVFCNVYFNVTFEWSLKTRCAENSGCSRFVLLKLWNTWLFQMIYLRLQVEPSGSPEGSEMIFLKSASVLRLFLASHRSSAHLSTAEPQRRCEGVSTLLLIRRCWSPCRKEGAEHQSHRWLPKPLPSAPVAGCSIAQQRFFHQNWDQLVFFVLSGMGSLFLFTGTFRSAGSLSIKEPEAFGGKCGAMKY